MPTKRSTRLREDSGVRPGREPPRPLRALARVLGWLSRVEVIVGLALALLITFAVAFSLGTDR
ncbi:hypothetical protein ARHIZOSPH14_31820 [Agromyces rhizosphaerae]|uniref:Uncharacterized protein n=1 Tax=Agromyces rhizosphaerae TaxID=88374 RepID=A0A9W6D0F7_9MICO|nr:hypothetical protein ARHIZOSPH14_31820 [Agromyces rhizosphaerae]